MSSEMDTDNVERYDRQIRLWGQHGQSRCAMSKVCLINANSLGIEILRGLCLAGIGSFTILDSHKLAAEDVGCSFIHQSCIGKSRAETAKQMLLDLNEEVSGEVYPIEAYLPHLSQNQTDCDDLEDNTQNLEFWKKYNCIIASGPLYTDQINRLSKICWTINTPLIICKSIGFVGSFTIQAKEHLIVEAHSDNPVPSFHLDEPFSDLKEYFDTIDLKSESGLDSIGKYPYIVLVYNYLKKWQAKNGFDSHRVPCDYLEKQSLKAVINQGLQQVLSRNSNKNSHGASQTIGEIPFENFTEASKSVNYCFASSSKLSESDDSILNHPRLKDCNVQNASRFWQLIKATKIFVEQKNDNRLPVSGTIPDMISSSEEYISLQSIYARKAKSDANEVYKIAQTLLNTTADTSLHEEVKLVCKNIRDLRLFSTSLICDEYNTKHCILNNDEQDDELVTICLCLKSLDLFYSTYGRLPGCQDNLVETDVGNLKDCLKQMFGKGSNQLKTLDQSLYEICRYGGVDLHATAAFMGGCVAQEVIKLVTNQYTPVDNTLVYNALTADTRCFKLNDILGKL